MESSPFADWAVLELMGHRRLAGYVTEQSIGGASFIRIDVPQTDGRMVTQFYSPTAVYSLTPSTEETVARVAGTNVVMPISPWDIRQIEAFDEDRE